jgi:hypothetical protein
MKALLIALALAAAPDAGPAAVDDHASTKAQEDAVWKLSIPYVEKQKRIEEIRATAAAAVENEWKALCEPDDGKRSYAQNLSCGDWLNSRKDPKRAVLRWKAAADGAETKADVCAPVERVRAVSVHPEADLAGVSPLVIQDCDQGRAMAQAAAAQKVRDAKACHDRCEDINRDCSNHADVGGIIVCAHQRSTCNDACGK